MQWEDPQQGERSYAIQRRQMIVRRLEANEQLPASEALLQVTCSLRPSDAMSERPYLIYILWNESWKFLLLKLSCKSADASSIVYPSIRIHIKTAWHDPLIPSVKSCKGCHSCSDRTRSATEPFAMTDASGDLYGMHMYAWLLCMSVILFGGWCWWSSMLCLLAILLQKSRARSETGTLRVGCQGIPYCFSHLEQLAMWTEARACSVQLLVDPPTSQQKADHPTPLQLQVTSSRHRRIIGRWLKQLWAFLAVKIRQILWMTKTYILKKTFSNGFHVHRVECILQQGPRVDDRCGLCQAPSTPSVEIHLPSTC